MLFAEDFFESGEDLRIFRGDVGGLSGVGGEVVELGFHGAGRGRGCGFGGFARRARAEILADGFPVADAHGLLAAVAGRFTVEERARLLRAAEELGIDLSGAPLPIEEELEREAEEAKEAEKVAAAAGDDQGDAEDGK